jgi:hypothetical protein
LNFDANLVGEHAERVNLNQRHAAGPVARWSRMRSTSRRRNR